MVFVGVYKAAFAYAPQNEQELALDEGDLLYILEKSEVDDWWKAKKKATEENEDEEPVGLIPNNYVEEVVALGSAKALYDYARQTDEELSLKEEETLEVYDTSDPDWTLVAINGEFGFVPATYIDFAAGEQPRTAQHPKVPSQADISDDEPTPTSESPVSSPAAALANIIQSRGKSPSSAKAAFPHGKPTRPQYTPDASDEESAPPMPVRIAAEPARREVRTRSPPRLPSNTGPSSPPDRGHRSGAFHLYNVHEVVSSLGRQRKLPTVLGINSALGIISLAGAKDNDGATQEWTAEKLSNYSIEGKHVFIELVKPSRSVDLHAGAKDIAEEIVSALGEFRGAVRAEGLKEVLAIQGSSKGPKMGRVLYEFIADGPDEVSVAEGDDVVILNDTASEEWWQVRRVKNGKEGVVPSTYIDIVSGSPAAASTPGNAVRSGLSTVEQNRLEEERLTKEAVSAAKKRDKDELPQRGSSLSSDAGQNGSASKDKQAAKPKPNQHRVRMWTDRSGSFKVEAEFLGCREGKIHLHKLNGVKIAVPVSKMSVADLEYVEAETGMSLDDEKPLADLKSSKKPVTVGASLAKDEYDWFDFFLKCGVDVHSCQRYATNFQKDSMDETVLPEITGSTLRNLGFKEGDILRIMRFLDNKFGRSGNKKKNVSFAGSDAANGEEEANGSAGGLFSGPGGTLRNNTRKGRPAPAVQTSDVVDAKAFLQSPSDRTPTATKAADTPTSSTASQNGFEDDAWSVKPARSNAATAPIQASAPAPQMSGPAQPPPTDAMRDLSLLQEPLQPAVVAQPPKAPEPQPPQQGATPSMFAQIAQHNTGVPPGYPSQPQNQPRQRPAPPATTGSGLLVPPPPVRPLSAPQTAQQSQFAPPPLVQQLTGYQPQFPVQSSLNNAGNSLNDLQTQQMRIRLLQAQQQQQQNQLQQLQLQAQLTGYGQQNMQFQNMPPPMPGFNPQLLTAQATGSPFANPPVQPFQSQPTGNFIAPQQTGSINNFLPPALIPQSTGFQNQNTGMLQPQGTGFQQNFGQMPATLPPVPPIPQQHKIAPLVPQRTGPAPPVRFGVAPAKKLTAQPTGRANLSKASMSLHELEHADNIAPENPFGFD